MQSDLYTFSAPLFVRHLNILSEILLIAEKHTTEHNIAPAALLSARLYPDMFPLTGQVRAACDTAQRTTDLFWSEHSLSRTRLGALERGVFPRRSLIVARPRRGSAVRLLLRMHCAHQSRPPSPSHGTVLKGCLRRLPYQDNLRRQSRFWPCRHGPPRRPRRTGTAGLHDAQLVPLRNFFSSCLARRLPPPHSPMGGSP